MDIDTAIGVIIVLAIEINTNRLNELAKAMEGKLSILTLLKMKEIVIASPANQSRFLEALIELFRSRLDSIQIEIFAINIQMME